MIRTELSETIMGNSLYEKLCSKEFMVPVGSSMYK